MWRNRSFSGWLPRIGGLLYGRIGAYRYNQGKKLWVASQCPCEKGEKAKKENNTSVMVQILPSNTRDISHKNTFFIPILLFVHAGRLLLYYEERNLSALVRIVILEVYTVSDKQAGLSLRGFTFFPSIPCQIVPPALYMFSLICRHHHLINLPLPALWKKCQDDTNCRPNKSGAKKKVFLDKCSYNLSAPLPLVTSSQHD